MYTLNMSLYKSVDDWSNKHGASGKSRDVDYRAKNTIINHMDNAQNVINTWLKDNELDFNKFHKGNESGEFYYCQVEDNDGCEDSEGRYLADYFLTVEIYESKPVTCPDFGLGEG